ncbi:MAG: hypothetical protein EAX87_14120, partial [Candidatus Thorarchaeota archaeon]|nr:hypothetical protein [Candidatus Thorarchaeota archaeon]
MDALRMRTSHLKCLGSLLTLALILPIMCFGLQSSPVLVTRPITSLTADSSQKENHSPNEAKSLIGQSLVSEAGSVPPSK